MNKLNALDRVLNIIKGKLFKASGVYLFSSFLNSVIPFLLLPILTRFLTPGDYGMVSMFMVLVSFTSPFTGLSTGGAVFKQYLDLDLLEMGRYIFNVLVILVTSSIVVFLMYMLFRSDIQELTNLPDGWIYLAILVASMNFVSTTLLSLWQVKMAPIFFGVFQNSRTLVNSGLSILLVVAFGLSWEGRLYGYIVSSILFGVIALYLLQKQGLLVLSYRMSYLKHSLNFGIPMIPTALKDAVLSITDKILIVNMVSLSSMGLYSVALQFSIPIALLSTSFNSAYVPILFKQLKRDALGTKLKIVKFTYLYFIFIALASLAWTMFASWLMPLVVDSSYYVATEYIFWLSLGFAFSGMHSMVVNYIYYTQNTARYGILSVLSLCLNVVLNFLLISSQGSIGAAQATCLTFFVFFLFTWRLSHKVYPMPWFNIF